MVKKRWKLTITNCKTYPGADCDTDHIQLIAKMRVKLARNKAKQKQRKVDLIKHENPTIRTTFGNETDRSFEEDLNQVEDQATEETSENLWTKYKTVLTETADKTLGKLKMFTKKPWISNEVLNLTEEKNQVKKARKLNLLRTSGIKN